MTIPVASSVHYGVVYILSVVGLDSGVTGLMSLMLLLP
jgi:hypothetical protein